MPKISLAAYTLRVREQGQNDLFQSIGHFNGNNDLLDFISNYLQDVHRQHHHDTSNRRLLRVKRADQDGRIISGVFETGEYGYESWLYDVEEDAQTYHRQFSEAELLPFFFFLNLPSEDNEGILLLQRFGPLGIRKILSDAISPRFRNTFNNMILEINPLIVAEAAREFLGEGRVIKISFVKYRIPQDIADAYAGSLHEEDFSQSELVVRARRGHSLPLPSIIRRIVDGDTIPRGLFEIRSFEYDTIKITVKCNRDTRTIDISNMGQFRSYFDITNEVELDSNGHPNYDSILTVARDFLAEIRRRMGETNA